LSNGDSVIVYQTPSGISFDELNSSLQPLQLQSSVASGPTSWVNAQPLSSGGFTVQWVSQGVLMAQDFTAQGAAADQPYAFAGPVQLARLAFSSNADGTTTVLPLPVGGSVTTGEALGPNGPGSTATYITRYNASGVLVPPLSLLEITPFTHTVKFAPLADGSYEAAINIFAHSGVLFTEHFSTTGALLSTGPTVYEAPGLGINLEGLSIAGLPDGGFVMAWTSTTSPANTPPISLYLQEYGPTGTPGPIELIGTTADTNSPLIDVLANGQYVVGWTSAGGPETATFTEQGPSLGQLNVQPPTGPEQFAAAGQPVSLAGAAGVASSALLSNGDIVLTSVAANGQTGSAEIFNASGQLLDSTMLQAFAGAGQTLDPQLQALTGGFFEVSYPGSTDYEIYNSSDQLVFSHNAFSPAGQSFTALADGAYVVVTPGANTIGFVDSAGNTNWLSLPDPALGTPTVNSLQDVSGLPAGVAILTYAGSTEYDLLIEKSGGGGAVFQQGQLGATVSDFATAFASSALGAPAPFFAFGWLSPDGGQDGLPTALDVQIANVEPSNPITVAQDLDPWHTQIALQTHVDDTVAALWSEGGAIWGAEVTVNGSSGPFAAGIAGALSDVVAIQVLNDEVGFAYVANGQAWAEIFNPATGAIERADLGAAGGDVSTIHAVATATGGLAVSWHNDGQVLASVLSAAGQASLPFATGGDLLGVDASGHAVAVSGEPASATLQTYGLNDGLFWMA
jgi:hypothetical protein